MEMTNREVSSVLLKAAAIVRKGWCTGAPAKDAEGRPCGPRDKQAVAWCAIGAIQKVCGGPEDGYEARYALRLVLPNFNQSVQEWNDVWAKDGEHVAEMFEKAAKQEHRS